MTFALWFAADAFDNDGIPFVSRSKRGTQHGDQTVATHCHPRTTTHTGHDAVFAISPEEEALVGRLREGDEAALTAIAAKYWDPLWRYAYRALRSSDAAADVVQDAFVSLWNRRTTIDPTRGARSYLFASVRFQIMKVRRHESVVRRAEDLNGAFAVAGVGEYLHGYADAIDEQALADALEHVIATLPEQRREILLLRWWYGLTYDEIAEIVGLGVSAIKMQVRRAVIMLRPLLEREFK